MGIHGRSYIHTNSLNKENIRVCGLLIMESDGAKKFDFVVPCVRKSQ